MSVRPFYLTASIDGRKTDLSGGPASKMGGQRVVITQREKGEIGVAFTVLSYPENINGVLYLITKVFDKENRKVAEHKTEY